MVRNISREIISNVGWRLYYCVLTHNSSFILYLQETTDSSANTVGTLFYGVLDVKCFTFEEGEYCSDESLLSQLICSNEGYGYMAVVKEFPYKWSDEDWEKDITVEPAENIETTIKTSTTTPVKTNQAVTTESTKLPKQTTEKQA